MNKKTKKIRAVVYLGLVRLLALTLSVCGTGALNGAVPQNGLIAFPGRDPQGRQQLFTITADGANRRQLTFENNNSLPSWSTDGTHLVYVSRTPLPYLTIMDADGSNKRTLRVGDWSTPYFESMS